jgi:hypothetical protein
MVIRPQVDCIIIHAMKNGIRACESGCSSQECSTKRGSICTRLNVTCDSESASPGPCFLQMGSVSLRFSKCTSCSSTTSCLQTVLRTKILSLKYWLQVSIATEEFYLLRYSACRLLETNSVSEENATATLKMKAIFSSETSNDFHRATRRYVPEDRIFTIPSGKTSNSTRHWNYKAIIFPPKV